MIDKRISSSAPVTLVAPRGATSAVPAIKLACIEFPFDLFAPSENPEGYVPYDTLIYQSGSIAYQLYTPASPDSFLFPFPHIQFLVPGIYHVTVNLWITPFPDAPGFVRFLADSQSALFVYAQDGSTNATYIAGADFWVWDDLALTHGHTPALSVSFDMPAHAFGEVYALFLPGVGNTVPFSMVVDNSGSLATSMEAHYIGPRPPSFEFVGCT